MEAWIALLIAAGVLVVSLVLMVRAAERSLADFRRRREVRRWEAGMLERLTAPGTDDSRLDDLRRLHAIVDTRLQWFGGRAPGLRDSLKHALCLCTTQPQAVRQKIGGERMPSIESIKSLIDRLDPEPEQGTAPDQPLEATPADAPAVEPESRSDGPAAKREGAMARAWRRANEKPILATLVAGPVVTVVGGLLVLWIAGWIGIGNSEGSGQGETTGGEPESAIVDQLALQHDLENVDLEGADVRGKSLRHKNMFEAVLIEAKLRSTDFTGTNLVKAELQDAGLTETVFVEARLREARFEGAEGNKPFFEHAKAAWAKFGGAQLPGGSFFKAHLPHAYMVEAQFPHGFFQEADLRAVEAKGAEFPNARLEASRLNDADLAEADLRGAQLYEADARSAEFDDADLRSANLCRADLRGADLSTARLEGARFDRRTQWPAGFDFEAHGVIEGGC